MSKHLEKILIGTSLTPESEQVVAAGLALARANGAAVELLHVFSLPLAYVGAPAEVAAEELAWFDSERRRLEEELAAQARRAGLRAEEGSFRVETGTPHRTLVERAAATGADLLVLGTAETGKRWPTLGSTTDRTLRKATCPVLALRPGTVFPPRRVLAPVDLSPLAAGALRCGLALLGAPGVRPAEVEVLFVLNPLERDGSLQFTPDQVARFAADELDRFVHAQLPGLDGRLSRRRVRTGYPREEILAEVAERGADLVVLATHGRGGVDRLLLGSVAGDVMREAPASALVVPPAAAGAFLEAEERSASADWCHVSDEVLAAG